MCTFSWQDPLARTEPKEFNTRAAGYAGIMARLEEARGKEAALASQAFSGMTELMNNAKQIVREMPCGSLPTSTPFAHAVRLHAAGQDGGIVRDSC